MRGVKDDGLKLWAKVSNQQARQALTVCQTKFCFSLAPMHENFLVGI